MTKVYNGGCGVDGGTRKMISWTTTKSDYDSIFGYLIIHFCWKYRKCQPWRTLLTEFQNMIYKKHQGCHWCRFDKVKQVEVIYAAGGCINTLLIQIARHSTVQLYIHHQIILPHKQGFYWRTIRTFFYQNAKVSFTQVACAPQIKTRNW